MTAKLFAFLGFTAFLQAQTWTLFTPAGSPPPPRASTSAVFDPTEQRMIIFGGQSSSLLQDAWTLSTGANAQWTALKPGGSAPRPRLGHVAALDARNNRMIVYGGGVGTPTPCLNDVFVLTNASGTGTPGWTQLQTSGAAPPARVFHTAAYDPNSSRMIVFGGRDCSQNGSFFNDVWILANVGVAGAAPSWSQIRPTGNAPSPRQAHTAVYDPSGNRMIVFGGDAGAAAMNDVWVLNNANAVNGTPSWSQVSPGGTIPAPRGFAAAVWDTVGNRMILTGGNNATAIFGDTFTLTGLNSPFAPPTWTQLANSGTPALASAGAVFDPGTNRMFLFAGNDGKAPKNETWVLSLGQQQPQQQVTVTTTSVPNGQFGIRYFAQLNAANGTPPYSSWTVAGGSLPPGLTLDPATGTITGTPTTSTGSPFSFTVTVKDAAGVVSAPQALTIAVPANASVVISTTSLPNAAVGVAYSAPLTATGGTPPYGNWAVTSGSLPPGLNINVQTGVISGTPATTSGSPFTFSVTVRDNASGLSPAATLSIAVTSGITITPTTLPGGIVGAAYSAQLIASNGTAPYSNWTVSSGAMPAGLILNASSGFISGTPTSAAGTYNFNVTVQDARQSVSAPQALSIAVTTGLSITSSSLPGGSVSGPYAAQLNAVGGTPPYSNWFVVSGTLPGGLTLSPSSGAILGIPIIAGTFTFGVMVRDNANAVSPTQTFSIVIAPRVNITTTSLPGATVGTAYSAQLTATGGLPPYSSWTISSGTLPAGLSLNAASGLIGGTPTSGSGTVSFSVTVKDNAGGTSVAQNLSISLGQPPPAITTAPASLTFSYRLGDPAPAVQSISVFSGGAFTVTVRSDQNFLVVTPVSGQTPTTIAASVNTTALRTAGTLAGQVIIALVSNPATTATIPVTLTVDQPAGPQLQISPSRFSLNAVQGGAPTHLQLAVLNAGGGTLNFTAQLKIIVGANWITLDNNTGSATFATPGSVGIALDPGPLNRGFYQADIVIQDQGSNQTQTCSIFLSVTARALSILLSQSGLQFNAAPGGVASPPQTFTVTNVGQGQLNWTASTEIFSGPDGWLVATPGSGVSNAGAATSPAVTVSINTARLTAGQYFGLVRIGAPGAANSPQTVTVVLDVTDPAQAPPPLLSDAGALLVGDTAAPIPPPAQFAIANLSGRTLSYMSTAATEDGRNWVNFSPATGTVAADRLTNIGVQTNFSGLTPGVRRGTLRLVFSDGSVRTFSVASVLPDNTTAPSAKSTPRQAGGCSPQGLVAHFTSLEPGFTVTGTTPVSLRVAVADTCGTPLTTGGVFVRFSNSSTSISLTHGGGGIWTGTWVPANTNVALGIVATAFSIGNPPLGGQTPILQGTVRTAAAPLARADRIIDGASFKEGDQVALGSPASLFGDGLADGVVQAPGTPYSSPLGTTQVRLGDLPLPLLYVSDSQVNALIPRDLAPNTQHQIVVMRGPIASVPIQVTVAEFAPGIFTVNAQGTGQGVVQIEGTGGQLAGPAADNARPAARGETVVIFLTGLGSVTLVPPDGAPAPVDEPSQTLETPVVTMGGANAPVAFSGLAPGIVGVYHVRAVVPDDAPSGDAVPLVVTAAGVPSNTVTLAIQ